MIISDRRVDLRGDWLGFGRGRAAGWSGFSTLRLVGAVVAGGRGGSGGAWWRVQRVEELLPVLVPAPRGGQVQP